MLATATDSWKKCSEFQGNLSATDSGHEVKALLMGSISVNTFLYADSILLLI